VEDEKLAQDVLKKYIGMMPSLQLINSCNNASDAISFLHSNKVDLIFLDINMPELSGIEFLKTLQHSPHIIITTAYSEYALEGYEYAVCDYLLKPIRYERFVKAINKVIAMDNRLTQDPAGLLPDQIADSIFLKEDNSIYKVLFSDILYVQAFGNYLKIFTATSKTIVTRITLVEIEAQLPATLFLRVHKSYIVSIKAIEKIKFNEIYINDQIIPLGITFKQEVLKHTKKAI
jgi:DNA-binding LytR/AlgR family response regulator